MPNFTYGLIMVFGCVVANTIPVQAQTPAFPGAEGAGMYTTGGRGTAASPTTVFEVTNLNDDNNPGSLRYALQASATYRTIVFRVSGTIHLNSKLNIRDNTTIAGQTAPGDGICLADYPVVISGSNVIVRYLRIRMGDKNQNKGKVDGSGGDDAFGGLGVNNVIIDHCSVSWSDDECLTIYRGDNLTIQWCFITEPLNYSYHFETGDADYEQHGYGGIQGGKRASIHHNLFADCRNRNPRFAGISTYSPDTVGVENADFRNNVIYNWGINTVYGGEGGNYNVVNNYYKWGPNTGSGVKYRICNPGNSATIPFGKWYVDGNYVDGSPTNTANNWSGVVMGSNVADDTVLSKVTTPFNLGYTVTTQAATDAFESVLQTSGAILPRRDTMDQRIVNDVRNRTGRIIDVQGGYPHGTDYSLTVNAWPTLNSTTPPVDTDHDGMPNDWETSHGLNPNDASDRNVYDAGGYTMIENYLNGVSGTSTSPAVAAGGTITAFSQITGTPSASQTYTVAGYNLTGNITITPPAGYELSLDGTAWYGAANPLVLTPASGTVNSTNIMVRLNASAEGTYAGNITHVSPGATTVNVAVTGVNTAIANGLGSFADIDGGFEHQTEGAYTTVTSHTSTTRWEASAAFSITSSNARTGSKYFHFNQSSSSNKYIFSPVLSSTPLAQNTSYVIQFWYRVPSAPTGTTTLSGSCTVTGATGGTGTNTTPATATLNASTTPGTWQFFSGVLTSPNASPTSTFAGIKVAAPATPFFDLDDYVLYAGTAVDATAPDAPASPTGSANANNKTISINWTAPATGTDGGGYVVVRSTSATAPTPNANGVYIAGNSMGTGYTVVYLGTATSFTDGDAALLTNTPYYYYIFTADKAYNYSATAATVNVTISGGSTPPTQTYNAVVAKDGSGNYTSVQAAISAAPAGQTSPYRIFIKKGKYVETVSIPSNKPFIQLIGESMAETIISYDNYSGKANPAGGTYGTSTCGTVIINAPDVMFMNLSVENSTAYGIDANAAVPAPGDGPQAVAVYTTSDRVVFYNCRLNGGQDTYYGGNNKGTRCYFKNCYIDGNTDFMFGSSTIIFDTCIIYPRTRLDNGSGGYVTAVNTKAESGYGYVFRDCKITKNRGFTLYTLGRPWQNDAGTADAAKSHNKVAFLNTVMGSAIKPEGWSSWDAGTNTGYITYGEYNSKKYDGTPVDVSSRVPWSKQLTAAEAAKYYNNDTVFVNANTPAMANWKPYSIWPELGAAFTPDLSVSNLIAKKGATTATITWNLTWPITGVTCALYRSNDKTNFTLVSSQVSTEDTAGNFSFSENMPPAGQTYYYIVRASKTGFAGITSDTGSVTSTSVIAVSGSLGSFLQGLGAPSSSQTYAVSGTNLTGNITITPPAGYEVSANNTTWYNSSSPLVLTQTGGVVASTNIAVRLNGTAAGSYSGNIVNASTGAASVNVGVSGTIQTDPLPSGSTLLEQWPLTADKTDSTAVRAAGINATTPVLNNLVISDGVTVAATPAYSPDHGQAYAATVDGYWTTAKGGPGGTLNRSFYEQFTVAADANHKLRIDSILLSTAFYNTSSNTKVAVVYSTSGFRKDSTEIKVASKNGSPVTAGTSGNFSSAFDVSNQTAATTDVFAMLVNGSAGVTVNPGDTLYFRIYHCTGSTSAGRYVQLKNVVVKGLSTDLTPPPPSAPTAITIGNVLTGFSQTIGKPSDEQSVTVTVANVQGAVTITPPAAYEISLDSGSTWNNTASVLTPAAGSTLLKGVLIRLNAENVGTFDGNVMVSTAGTSSVNIPVTGTVYSEYTLNPNPARNYVNVYHAKLYTTAVITIFNMSGYVVGTYHSKPAANYTTIDISRLATGMYFVEVRRLGERVLLRFIKQ